MVAGDRAVSFRKSLRATAHYLPEFDIYIRTLRRNLRIVADVFGVCGSRFPHRNVWRLSNLLGLSLTEAFGFSSKCGNFVIFPNFEISAFREGR